jgi:hypothetical protein
MKYQYQRRPFKLAAITVSVIMNILEELIEAATLRISVTLVG